MFRHYLDITGPSAVHLQHYCVLSEGRDSKFKLEVDWDTRKNYEWEGRNRETWEEKTGALNWVQ